MRKFITILGAVLLTASTAQIASAGQRDKVRKMDRAQPTQSQQFRDSNAYYGSRNDGLYNNYRDERRLQALSAGGATSAPAGR